MVQLAESTLASLPGLDCGLCGAPTCKELAKDVSTGDAGKTDCVFFSKTRLDELRAAYVRPQRHE
jgi:Na+-translocating ferredoxin:NAD+ oxidoreductase RNF subunit RnfB